MRSAIALEAVPSLQLKQMTGNHAVRPEVAKERVYGRAVLLKPVRVSGAREKEDPPVGAAAPGRLDQAASLAFSQNHRGVRGLIDFKSGLGYKFLKMSKTILG